MKIAYRRMSGAIGLSMEESGTRGLWWEKRWAVIRALQKRGHEVHLTSRLTKASQKKFKGGTLSANHDVLIIEFGSSNASFYGEDLEQTQAQVAAFRGKQIIFICDDPDLPFIWKQFPDEDWSRWRAWYNASNAFAGFGGHPAGVRVSDFPVSSLMAPQEAQDVYNSDLIYFGRPNGREKAVKLLVEGKVPFVVAGRWDEWQKFPNLPVVEAPDQPYRSSFYANSLGSLVLADSKHKRLGWRTGRAFHAIMAGCPAVAEADHEALSGVSKFSTADELHFLIKEWQSPKKRKLAWRAQRDWVVSQLPICEKAFEAVGL